MIKILENMPSVRDTMPEKQFELRLAIDAVRTATERLVALTALIALSIPMCVVALITKCLLGSPILFKQLRVGKDVENFMICKFRTMRDTRDETGHLLPDRLRETKVSRILRKIRLDEFPQLFAIVEGSMAFIGPRPLLPETIRAMGELGKLRCRIRPGLSGWAQVNGNTKLSNNQKLSLDIWYIDNRNIFIDMLIVWKTFLTIVRGEKFDQINTTRAEKFVAERYGALLEQSGCLP